MSKIFFLLLLQFIFLTGILAQTYTLEFNEKGEHIKGFPAHIIEGDIISFKLPESKKNTTLFILLNKLDSLIKKRKLISSEDSARKFLVMRPQLFWLFVDNKLVSDKVDTNTIVGNFQSYLKNYHNYFCKLKKDKKISKTGFYPAIGSLKNEFDVSIAKDNDELENLMENRFVWKAFRIVKYQIVKKHTDNITITTHLDSTIGLYKKERSWLKQLKDSVQEESAKLISKLEILFSQKEKQVMLQNKDSIKTWEIIVTHLNSLETLVEIQQQIQYSIIQENREWIKSWLWFTGLEPTLNPFKIVDPDNADLIKNQEKKINLLKEQLAFYKHNIETKNIKKFPSVKELMIATDTLQEIITELTLNETKLEVLKKQQSSFGAKLNELKLKSQVLHHGTLFGQESENIIHWTRYHDKSNYFKIEQKSNHPKKYYEDDNIIQVAINVPITMKVTLAEKIEPYTPKSIFTEAIEPSLEALLSNLTSNFSELLKFRKPSTEVVPKSNDNIISNIEFSPEENEKLNTLFRNNGLRFTETVKEDLLRITLFENITLNKIEPELIKNKLQEKENFQLTQKINETRFLKDIIALLNNIVNKRRLLIQENIKANKHREEQNIFIANTKTFQLLFPYFKNLYGWSNKIEPPLQTIELEEKKDTIFYSTQILPASEMDGFKNNQYKISSSIGTETKEEASYKYAKYKTSLIQPFAAFVFTDATRSSFSYNPENQTFTDINLGKSDVVLGIKIFPFRTWIENNSFMGLNCKSNLGLKSKCQRGLSPVNRFAFTAGLGVTKNPLKNYFTGISFDIISGLGFQGGLNFYGSKNYELFNGAVKKETERFKTAWYWGVSVDPVVMLKLFNIINFN